MKSKRLIVGVTLLLLITSTIAFAERGFKNSHVTFIVDGTTYEQKITMFYFNGKRIFPARTVFETLGMYVTLDRDYLVIRENPNQLINKSSTEEVKVQVDSDLAYVKYSDSSQLVTVQLSGIVRNLEGSLYISVEDLNEVFNLDVNWDEAYKTLTINRLNHAQPQISYQTPIVTMNDLELDIHRYSDQDNGMSYITAHHLPDTYISWALVELKMLDPQRIDYIRENIIFSPHAAYASITNPEGVSYDFLEYTYDAIPYNTQEINPNNYILILKSTNNEFKIVKVENIPVSFDPLIPMYYKVVMERYDNWTYKPEDFTVIRKYNGVKDEQFLLENVPRKIEGDTVYIYLVPVDKRFEYYLYNTRIKATMHLKTHD